MRGACVLVLLAALLAARRATADDLEDKSFSLRFSAAQSRFSRYPDAAAIGGGGAGSPWSSSPNPASTGMNPPVGDRRWGASAQYVAIAFESGANVHLAALSGARETKRWGSWQPSVLGITSNRSTTNDGLSFEWEAVSAEVQWGKAFWRQTALGLNVNVLASEMDFGLGGATVVESTSTSWGLRLGALHACSERLYVGAALDLGASPSTTKTHDVLGLGVGTTTEEDTTRSLSFRAGLYTFLTKDLTLYADYQLAAFADDTGHLDVHRLSLGLDQTIVRGLYLRAGGIVDHWGNLTGTAGLGLAPSERVLIDVGYQYDMFPELAPEFGRAHVVGIGLSVLL